MSAVSWRGNRPVRRPLRAAGADGSAEALREKSGRPGSALRTFSAMPAPSHPKRRKNARIAQVVVVYLGVSWAVLQVADLVCLKEGHGRRKPMPEFEPFTGEAAILLGITPEEEEDILTAFREAYEAEKEILG